MSTSELIGHVQSPSLSRSEFGQAQGPSLSTSELGQAQGPSLPRSRLGQAQGSSLSRSELWQAQSPAEFGQRGKQPEHPAAKRRKLCLGAALVRPGPISVEVSKAVMETGLHKEEDGTLEEAGKGEVGEREAGRLGLVKGKVMGTGDLRTAMDEQFFPKPEENSGLHDTTADVVNPHGKGSGTVTDECLLVHQSGESLASTKIQSETSSACSTRLAHPNMIAVSTAQRKAGSTSLSKKRLLKVNKHVQFPLLDKPIGGGGLDCERVVSKPKLAPPPLYTPGGADPASCARLILVRFDDYFFQLSCAQSAALTRLPWGQPVPPGDARHPSGTLDFRKKSKKRKEASFDGLPSLPLTSDCSESPQRKALSLSPGDNWLSKRDYQNRNPSSPPTTLQKSPIAESSKTTPARRGISLRRKSLPASPSKSDHILPTRRREDSTCIVKPMVATKVTTPTDAAAETTMPRDTGVSGADTSPSLASRPVLVELQAEETDKEQRGGTPSLPTQELSPLPPSCMSVEENSPRWGGLQLAQPSPSKPQTFRGSTFLTPGRQHKRRRTARFVDESDSEMEYSPLDSDDQASKQEEGEKKLTSDLSPNVALQVSPMSTSCARGGVLR